MEVTATTWAIALIGLPLISLLGALQVVAVLRRRAQWTIDNVYGGSPDATDPTAYFALSQHRGVFHLIAGWRTFTLGNEMSTDLTESRP